MLLDGFSLLFCISFIHSITHTHTCIFFKFTNGLPPTEDNLIKDTKICGGWKNMLLRKRIFRNPGLKDNRRGRADTVSRQF